MMKTKTNRTAILIIGCAEDGSVPSMIVAVGSAYGRWSEVVSGTQTNIEDALTRLGFERTSPWDANVSGFESCDVRPLERETSAAQDT